MLRIGQVLKASIMRRPTVAQRLVRPAGSASRVQPRLFSSSAFTAKKEEPKQPESLLTDDLLAKAGIDPTENSARTEGETKEGAESSAEGNPEGGEPKKGKRGFKSSHEIKRERRARYAYIASLLGGLGFGVYMGRDWEDDETDHMDIPNGYSPDLIYKRAKTRILDIFSYYREPSFKTLLPPPPPEPYRRDITLVLGLEDFLIHSEWDVKHGWRTAKRPGLDYFLTYLAQFYEIVIFSSNYMAEIDRVINKIDPLHVAINHVLAREETNYKDGKIIKDLSYMNRDLAKIIIIDADPDAYSLQPENAIPVPKWTGNADDRELLKIIAFLEFLASQPVKDVRPILKSFEGTYLPDEYLRREKLAREKYLEKHANKRSFLSGDAAAKPQMYLDRFREENKKHYARVMKQFEEQKETLQKQMEAEMLAQQQNMTLGNIAKFWMGDTSALQPQTPADANAAANAAPQTPATSK